MPGLALPSAALRLPASPQKSQQPSPAVSPARNLPGTLLPLTGVPSSPCSETLISPTLNLKALIPDHVDEDIFERYDFQKEQLGQGGYGSVFLATDRLRVGRVVAVKKAMMLDGEMRENFQQEVGIMKDLDHPNICRVYESYDHGRYVYLVMEYCSGGDLFEYVLKNQGLPEPKVAEILRQVASALKHAHDKGIAHRDLKPENVCFSEDMHVKVIDWGLGFYFKRARMTSSVGSSAYTAPEVTMAEAYTARCDIWSLGAVACVMLSGEPPFYGRSNDEAWEPCGNVWQHVTPSVKHLVQRMLSSEPQDRPSADDILEHPFIRTENAAMRLASQQVLANLQRYSSTSTFLSLCAASVAQQLSRSGLQELQAVFQELDANKDGILQLHEVRSGFEQIFGKGSAPLEEIDEMFQRLDIDGSGAIDYTEFLAAGLGIRVNRETDALWAAFKAFDVHENDGNITKQEIAQVLYDAGDGQMFSWKRCEQIAQEVVQQFDRDGNGSLDFDEWLLMMKRPEDPDSERRVSL